jgi:hypothetical protein
VLLLSLALATLDNHYRYETNLAYQVQVSSRCIFTGGTAVHVLAVQYYHVCTPVEWDTENDEFAIVANGARRVNNKAATVASDSRQYRKEHTGTSTGERQLRSRT